MAPIAIMNSRWPRSQPSGELTTAHVRFGACHGAVLAQECCHGLVWLFQRPFLAGRMFRYRGDTAQLA